LSWNAKSMGRFNVQVFKKIWVSAGKGGRGDECYVTRILWVYVW